MSSNKIIRYLNMHVCTFENLDRTESDILLFHNHFYCHLDEMPVEGKWFYKKMICWKKHRERKLVIIHFIASYMNSFQS